MEDKAFIILASGQALICVGEDSVRCESLEEVAIFLLFGPKRLAQKYKIINLLGYSYIEKVPEELAAPIDAMFAVRRGVTATVEKAAAVCQWLKDVIENHPERCVIKECWKDFMEEK